jgi:hypothetical protein
VADPVKLNKLIKIFRWMPQILVPAAMTLAEYSNKEIADLSFCRFLQHALPGRSLKGLKAHVAGDIPTLPVPPDCTKQHQHHADINTIIGVERTPSVDHAINHMAGLPANRITPPAFSTEPNPDKVSPVGTFVDTLMATTASKRKQNNCTYYMKKRELSPHLLPSPR